MNDTTSDEQQPRIPGVRYKAETRFRQETTVIDGRSSTRDVPYTVYVAQPPRDWDRIIFRSVTGLAIGITGLAAIGTTASVGGQLSEILHPFISYGVGVVFTATWLACLGLEWVLSQTDPKRAVPARVGGWIALVISMAAVFTYGHDHGQDLAGGVGACLDLLAKGLWALLIYAQDVPLRPGIANWVQDQAEEAAGQAKLARRITALNRIAEQHRAVGGREYQAAGEIMTSAQATPALPAPAPVVHVAEPVPAPAPVVPNPAPVPPAPQPPVQPSGQTGQSAGYVSAPVSAQAPVPPATGQPSAQATAPAAPVAGQPSGQPAGHLNVFAFAPSQAGLIRQALAEDPAITDEDLIDRVRQTFGDNPKLAASVRRQRHREENPPAKKPVKKRPTRKTS